MVNCFFPHGIFVSTVIPIWDLLFKTVIDGYIKTNILKERQLLMIKT